MIEDLEVIVESRPTLRDRWLMPALGALALTAVLASSFVQLAPVRAGVTQHVSSVSVIQGAPPATGIRALELPRTVATVAARTQLSGVTGLTPMDLSDGFRDLYRFEDGRLLIVLEYPDPSGVSVAAPSGAIAPPHRLTVRGTTGLGYATATASLPTAIAWRADGMQYVVGGASFTEEELVRLATQLR
ncbi:MAG TPA: hypothetical protein VGA38_09195 [Candidatus Limnocylindria bacterium]